MPNKPTVYTWHKTSAQMTAESAHYARLLSLWSESWSRHGWDPVIIDPNEHLKYPGHEQLHNHLYSLPTCNPKDYEMGCWLRWLAMAILTEQRGPALLVDTDCINYGFRPCNLPINLPSRERSPEFLFLDAGNVCCATYVTAPAARMFLREMMAYHPTHAQCSDMIFFMDWIAANPEKAKDFLTWRVCGGYNAHYPNWNEFPVIHFASGATQGRAGKQRVISEFVHPVSGVQYVW